MQHQVIVIGTGQAGLALGYYLSRAGVDFVIVDAAERVGASWRKWWTSLRLFTPARYNAMPGAGFPGPPDAYPGKEEVAAFLEGYAERLALPLRLGSRVTGLRRNGGLWELEMEGGGVLFASLVVVATGSHARQVIPAFASELSRAINQSTAMSYVSPTQLPPGDTLVVGAGNSGVQIAMELAASRRTLLAGRGTARIPARVMGVDVFWWLDHLRVTRWDVESHLGRRIVESARGKGDPVVGVTKKDLDASKVERRPPLIGIVEGKPQLADGSIVDVRNVVWCSGLAPDSGWIEGLDLDAQGNPLQRRGRALSVDDLFFIGLRFQMRIGSGMLGGVGRDAEELASAITARLRERGSTPARTALRPGDRLDGSRASSSGSD